MSHAADNEMLSVTIDDVTVLRAAYMPFIKGGGLFIPTTPRHALGDEVFVLLALPGEPSRLPVAGPVVWITPVGAQGGRTPGIGIRFDDRDDLARQHITAILENAGDASGQRETYTM